jgi:hypothetical protein
MKRGTRSIRSPRNPARLTGSDKRQSAARLTSSLLLGQGTPSRSRGCPRVPPSTSGPLSVKAATAVGEAAGAPGPRPMWDGTARRWHSNGPDIGLASAVVEDGLDAAGPVHAVPPLVALPPLSALARFRGREAQRLRPLPRQPPRRLRRSHPRRAATRARRREAQDARPEPPGVAVGGRIPLSMAVRILGAASRRDRVLFDQLDRGCGSGHARSAYTRSVASLSCPRSESRRWKRTASFAWRPPRSFHL